MRLVAEARNQRRGLDVGQRGRELVVADDHSGHGERSLRSHKHRARDEHLGDVDLSIALGGGEPGGCEIAHHDSAIADDEVVEVDASVRDAGVMQSHQ